MHMKIEVLHTSVRSNKQGYYYSFNDLGLHYSYLIERKASFFCT